MSFSPTLSELVGQTHIVAEKSMKAIRYIYSGIGTIVILTYFALPNERPFTLMSPMILTFGIAFLLLGLSTGKFIELVTAPHMTGEANQNLFVPRTILIDEERVRVMHDNGIVFEVPWKAVTKLRHFRYVLYIQLSKHQTILIPERAFPETRDWNTFLNLAEREVADNNLRPLLSKRAKTD